MAQQTRPPRGYAAAARGVPRGVRAGRTAAEPDGEVVVFLLGMRFNRLRRVRSWWPVVAGMPRMLAELGARPELGLLGARSYWSGRDVVVVQYWRSMAQLGAYARDPGLAHQPAWAAFNARAAAGGDVGIWHETYRVDAEDVESVYANLPVSGLAAATRAVPWGRRRRPRAADAMGQAEQDPAAGDAERRAAEGGDAERRSAAVPS